MQLTMLDQIGEPSMSQRRLAEELGIGVASANQMVSRAVLAGWVAKSGDNPRRTRYQLTRAGQVARRQLAYDLLFDAPVYRVVRQDMERAALRLRKRGIDDVALYGRGPRLELALVALLQHVRVRGLLPESGYGLPRADLSAGSVNGLVSVSNEIPAAERRVAKHQGIPLIFFT